MFFFIYKIPRINFFAFIQYYGYLFEVTLFWAKLAHKCVQSPDQFTTLITSFNFILYGQNLQLSKMQLTPLRSILKSLRFCWY